MSILIHRQDKEYGPYSIEEVKGLVLKKLLAHQDWARLEGAMKWQPLEHLLIQHSFRQQREAYVASMNSAPDKKRGKKSKHANRWLWKPE